MSGRERKSHGAHRFTSANLRVFLPLLFPIALRLAATRRNHGRRLQVRFLYCFFRFLDSALLFDVVNATRLLHHPERWRAARRCARLCRSCAHTFTGTPSPSPRRRSPARHASPPRSTPRRLPGRRVGCVTSSTARLSADDAPSVYLQGFRPPSASDIRRKKARAGAPEWHARWLEWRSLLCLSLALPLPRPDAEQSSVSLQAARLPGARPAGGRVG